MSKMFYTLQEAAEKLGKSEDDVRKMAETGQIQEFRDRDKLMFKVDQIDLLIDDTDDEPDAGASRTDPADMSSMIPLAADEGSGGSSMLSLEESAAPAPSMSGGEEEEESKAESGAVGVEPSPSDSGTGAFDLETSSDETAPGGSRAGSGSGSGLGDSKGKSGVSIFDADELEEADPSAVTQVSDQGGLDDLSLENVGSGSGLMDLTRESDDTSLGADAFLDDLSSDSGGSMAGAGASGEMPTATDLFEGSEQDVEAAPTAPAAVATVAAEPYDGKGSGLVGGLAFGAIIALAVGVLTVITGMMGVADLGFTTVLADQFMIVVGAMAGVTLLAGVLGLLLGSKS